MTRNWTRRAAFGAGAALAMAATAAQALDLPFLGASDPTPAGEDEANTRYGRVRGETEGSLKVFRGVPYGAPTGGAARFMAPQPPRPWGGVRDTRKYGDQCPQRPGDPPPYAAGWRLPLDASDDCLSLNIWTPGLRDGKKRPVIVWIHDGFSQGAAVSKVTDGARLAARGDAVVVSVSHRLNLFGYLNLAEAGGARYADSGHVGQLDLVAALSWISLNILEFGGDPGRVTLLGHGEGAGKVAALLAMPAARGLFHRAILQSPRGLGGATPAASAAVARKVMEAIGAGDPDSLQRAAFSRLLDGLKAVTPEDGPPPFAPVIDGRVIAGPLLSAQAAAVMPDVPVVIGTTAEEVVTLGLANPPAPDWPTLKAKLAALPVAGDLDKLIADLRAARPSATPADLFVLAATDRLFAGPARALAEVRGAQNKAATHLYRLDFASPLASVKAGHGVDLPLAFDNVAAGAALYGNGAAAAQGVAEQITAAWIAFARSSSPNAAGMASWPRYDTRSRSTMLLGAASRAVNDPASAERLAFAALPASQLN
ncbi:MAG: carboxylesterase family protein [Caulobacteraceae bacterium]